MVILVTSSSSSKTEFTRIFYDVFDVGGYAGSSQLEVSLLYLLAYLPCLFLLFPTNLSLLNSELICRSYGSFGPSGSTAGWSGSTAWVLQAVVPLKSGSTAPER